MRKQALGNGRKAARTPGRGSFTHMVSGIVFLNNLSGDVHANVTCVRNRGDGKNCT
jgi:hypothetical protein